MEFLVSTFGWESLIFIAFMFLCFLWFYIRFDEKAVVYGPTILTTTGIFATFVGIALSLKSLNTDNIQESIPFLLNGLKTAFWASVFGVGFALLIKFRFYLLGVKSADEHAEPSSQGGGGDKDLSAEILQSLVAIKDGISGEGSNSLVYQIRTLRDDSNKRLDDLKETQKESLRQLTEMSSKTLVEALRDVIRDFNDKITEQFGENFKELNYAVGKLLEWQDKYRLHIESIIERHDHIVASMQSASDSYAQLVSKGESFSSVAEELSHTLGYLDAQKNALNQMLEHLIRLVDTASGRIPEVEQRMIAIASQLASSVEKNQGLLDSAFKDASNNVVSMSESLSRSITESQSKANAVVLETANTMNESVQSLSRDMQSANASLNKHIDEMAEKLNNQVTVLDAALSEELTKSLESLGKQLAALSEKFVRDYEPLTDRLREVVGMAKKL